MKLIKYSLLLGIATAFLKSNALVAEEPSSALALPGNELAGKLPDELSPPNVDPASLGKESLTGLLDKSVSEIPKAESTPASIVEPVHEAPLGEPLPLEAAPLAESGLPGAPMSLEHSEAVAPSYEAPVSVLSHEAETAQPTGVMHEALPVEHNELVLAEPSHVVPVEATNLVQQESTTASIVEPVHEAPLADSGLPAAPMSLEHSEAVAPSYEAPVSETAQPTEVMHEALPVGHNEPVLSNESLSTLAEPSHVVPVEATNLVQQESTPASIVEPVHEAPLGEPLPLEAAPLAESGLPGAPMSLEHSEAVAPSYEAPVSVLSHEALPLEAAPLAESGLPAAPMSLEHSEAVAPSYEAPVSVLSHEALPLETAPLAESGLPAAPMSLEHSEVMASPLSDMSMTTESMPVEEARHELASTEPEAPAHIPSALDTIEEPGQSTAEHPPIEAPQEMYTPKEKTILEHNIEKYATALAKDPNGAVELSKTAELPENIEQAEQLKKLGINLSLKISGAAEHKMTEDSSSNDASVEHKDENLAEGGLFESKEEGASSDEATTSSEDKADAKPAKKAKKKLTDDEIAAKKDGGKAKTEARKNKKSEADDLNLSKVFDEKAEAKRADRGKKKEAKNTSDDESLGTEGLFNEDGVTNAPNDEATTSSEDKADAKPAKKAKKKLTDDEIAAKKDGGKAKTEARKNKKSEADDLNVSKVFDEKAEAKRADRAKKKEAKNTSDDESLGTEGLFNEDGVTNASSDEATTSSEDKAKEDEGSSDNN